MVPGLGIEPRLQGSKPHVLPLHYPEVGVAAGNRTQINGITSRCLTVRLQPPYGAIRGTRTLDILLGKQALYQLSYYRVVTPRRIELRLQG